MEYYELNGALEIKKEWDTIAGAGEKRIRKYLKDVKKEGCDSNIELANKYLIEMKEYQSGSYLVNSKYTLCQFLQFLGGKKLHITDVKRADLIVFHQILTGRTAKATVIKNLNILVTFYDWLVYDAKLMGQEFLNDLKRHRKKYGKSNNNHSKKHKRRVLDKGELRKLIEGCRNLRDKTIITLLYKTGIRIGELRLIDYGDITFEKHDRFGQYTRIEIKSHAKRNIERGDWNIVFLDEEATKLLKSYLKEYELKDDMPIFRNPEGMRLTRTLMGRRVKMWASAEHIGLVKEGDEPITPHAFRWSFSTHLRLDECPEWVIRALRGDTDKDMVDHYFRVGEEHIFEKYAEHIPKIGITPDI